MHKLISKALVESYQKRDFPNPMREDEQHSFIVNTQGFSKSNGPFTYTDLSQLYKPRSRIYVPLSLLDHHGQEISCNFTYDSGADFSLLIPRKLYFLIGEPPIDESNSKNVSGINDQVTQMKATHVQVRIGRHLFKVETLINDDSSSLLIGNTLIPNVFTLEVKDSKWSLAPSKNLECLRLEVN